jgi:hypothetical protein
MADLRQMTVAEAVQAHEVLDALDDAEATLRARADR